MCIRDRCKIGYVGAFPYAEVISGFTSFYLGVKSVCDSATMEVKYTNSWASFDLEKECAEQLIADEMCIRDSRNCYQLYYYHGSVNDFY